MNKIVFLTILFLCTSNVFSQNEGNKDSTSILSFADKIIIKVNLDTQTDSYHIRSENEQDLHLSANNQFKVGLSLDYEFIGFSYGFSPKFLPGNNDDDLKGKSSFVDYRFRFFLKNWTHELHYKNVQGFYVRNMNDFDSDWVEGQDSYIQFPDLKTTFWGGSTSYVLNPEFSLRNVVYNTEWQRKSAGSFIPTLTYNYIHISNRLDDGKAYENIFDIGISPRYYYSLVVDKNWFVSAFASPTLNIRFSKEKAQDFEESNIYWPLSILGGLQFGYSSKRIISGLDLKFESTYYNEDTKTNITNDMFYAKLYFGYRFDVPKKIKKIVNRIK